MSSASAQYGAGHTLTLDALRRSDWLQSSPSAGGSYPPLNVFRKGDDFALVAEVPGISPSDLEI